MDLTLRFGSVTHQATVFVNGKKVTEHVGGYMPFNVPLHDVVHFDRKNKLVVRVNNELNDTTLPAGETTRTRKGKKIVQSEVNFYNYAGIQRPVKLVARPKEHIVDFSVSFEVMDSAAKVHYTVETNGEHDVRVLVSNEEQEQVATSSGKSGVIAINDVRLWKPLNAYLYTFTLQIVAGDQVIDEYSEEIGIRTVKVKGSQLLINGEPVTLKGFSMQEESELHGAGYNPAFLKRDFELLKWSGANCIRTANFPHVEEFYQLADKAGLIVINELPAAGLKTKKGNRFNPITEPITPYFDREIVQTVTKKHHLIVLEELIKRDKNRASVCIWSLMSEPDSDYNSVATYAEEIFTQAHKLDPQKRPRTVVFSMETSADTNKLHPFCDLIALNRFDGWDTFEGYEITDAEEVVREELTKWSELGKPLVITSYGAEALDGEVKLPSVQWSENYQIEALEMQQRIFADFPNVVGELVWSFADFQTPEGLTSIDGNRSGVFTKDRQPKMAAYYLKKRWTNQ